MVDLIWVKMPSSWVSRGILKENFSSKRTISTDIAALKIFMYLCLYSQPIKRKKPNLMYWLPKNLQSPTTVIVTQAEAALTYDDLCSGCALSRKLVSQGLKKLVSQELIVKEGTKRKIKYIIQGSLDSGWAKLPKRELIKINNEVGAFQAIKNRYEYERNSLKLFIYLLTVRNNRLNYTEVSRGKINKSTNIDLYHIDDCLGYLQGIGLIEKVEDLGYTVEPHNFSEKFKLHRYYVVGSSGLIKKEKDT